MSKLLKQLESAEKNRVRKELATAIGTPLLSVKDTSARSVYFSELRNRVAECYALSEEEGADDAALTVLAPEIPATLSNKWLKNQLPGFLDVMFKGVPLVGVIWGLESVTFSPDNPLKDILRNRAESLKSEVDNNAMAIWKKFKDKLMSEQEKVSAGSVKQGQQRIGTHDSQGAVSDSGQFSQWENFGMMKWSDWKKSRV